MIAPFVVSFEKPYYRTVTPVPRSFGLPAKSQIAIEWRDDGTVAKLLVGGRIVSTAQADLDTYHGPPPKFVKLGRDRFVVFWTGCATCEAQNYMLLTPRRIVQTEGFETAWAPNFARDGVVHAYPRHEEPDPKWTSAKNGRLQKTWRWDGRKKRFFVVGEAVLPKLPAAAGRID